MNQKLSEPVTMQEITAATYQLGASKAPGPDGINGIFFQNHWWVINQDLFTEIQQFFETGILNPDLNKTAIVLIPKTPNPEKLEQFPQSVFATLHTKSSLKSSQSGSNHCF